VMTDFRFYGEFFRETVRGRLWVVGLDQYDHVAIRTPCRCGRLMQAHVSSLNVSEASCFIGCRARLRVPKKVAGRARRIASERWDAACERRAKAGGPGGWYPL